MLVTKGLKVAKQSIVLGGGCFWCIEGVFSLVNGVMRAVSGYAGGESDNPSYEQVCSGSTGHAEVVLVEYDDSLISLHEILEIFFAIHDPTSLNKQGADTGTQYRSVVYCCDDAQKHIVLDVIETAKKHYNHKIVTEVSLLDEFYKAEEYHQHYFKRNSNQGYCQMVIAPKIEKFKKHFKDKLQ